MILPPPQPTTSAERSFALPDGCVEVLHLMGVSHLAEFLSFASERANLSALSGALGDSVMMELAESWRDAAGTFATLAATDPYPVEPPHVFPIPASMAAHCEQLISQPRVQRQFDRVPIALAMVPLARLICAKERIVLGDAERDPLAATRVADEALMLTCLPLQKPAHAIDVQCRSVRSDEGSVTFVSETDQLQLLQPTTVTGEKSQVTLPVRSTEALTLPVGFACNIFNVIRFQDRLLLNDGHQRAHALMRRGVTHVPTIIQVCRHWEDVALVASSGVQPDKAVHFESARPPLLKDFSDRRLTISLAVPKMRKFVRVNYQVETGYFAS